MKKKLFGSLGEHIRANWVMIILALCVVGAGALSFYTINDINEKKPDVVFVCLGVPKQEKWIYKNKDNLNAKVLMGLGGGLDVFAGEVKRAPQVYQKLNIEWLYRLCKEPKRIGRMMDLPKFAFTVVTKGKREEK